MIRKKLAGVYMQEKDLAELYTYLELFGKVYDGYDKEIEKLSKGIEGIYAEEHRCENPQDVLRRLRNPRDAGRKHKYTREEIDRVQMLSDEGMSIRGIADVTGMPKSSVQRWLKK